MQVRGVWRQRQAPHHLRQSRGRLKVVDSGAPCRYYSPMEWPSNSEVEKWLRSQMVVDGRVTDAGAGTWSKCWSFSSSAQLLLVKIGPHQDDLRADVHAARWSSQVLPIPSVLKSGDVFGAGFVIMEYRSGNPLEASSAAEWTQLIPSVVDMLEGLRTADVSQSRGWGDWAETMHGRFSLWTDFLADSATPPTERIGEWEQFLRSFSDISTLFDAGVADLQEQRMRSFARSLVHGDLLYRNVHVASGRVNGVFDWGCAQYGDHLYDLSWFEFWAPWFPEFQFADLLAALRERWAQAGYVPTDFDQRRRACLLSIGVSHLGWFGSLRNPVELRKTATRIAELTGMSDAF
jgi:hygromycin-B 4-O-kinase